MIREQNHREYADRSPTVRVRRDERELHTLTHKHARMHLNEW